jgi:hypothetical protein
MAAGKKGDDAGKVNESVENGWYRAGKACIHFASPHFKLDELRGQK